MAQCEPQKPHEKSGAESTGIGVLKAAVGMEQLILGYNPTPPHWCGFGVLV